MSVSSVSRLQTETIELPTDVAVMLRAEARASQADCYLHEGMARRAS